MVEMKFLPSPLEKLRVRVPPFSPPSQLMLISKHQPSYSAEPEESTARKTAGGGLLDEHEGEFSHIQAVSMGEREEVLPVGDKLILRGVQFHGYHGVHKEEKHLGQKFLVDVDAWLDLREAGETDSLSNTVSYTDIYRIIKEIIEGPSRNLIESVAHSIASTTLERYPPISAIRVKVGKPHVAVRGSIDYLGVEILRRRPKNTSD